MKVIDSPIYALLMALTPLKRWLREGVLEPALLRSVPESQWVNLFEPTVLAQIGAGKLAPRQVLMVTPRWKLTEAQHTALREPQVRALIEKGIISFDRFASLNDVQCYALQASEGLRNLLLKGKMVAPYFLRQSPLQLRALVEDLRTPVTVL